MGLLRSMDISDLVDADSGQEIVVAPPLFDRFAELRGKYEEFLAVGYKPVQLVSGYIKEVVLPCDINIFLQQTREFENYVNYNYDTGVFISQLIRNSYDAGNNDFELDMNSLKIMNNVASGVSGTKERMVRVVVTGEVGNWCGDKAQHSTFIIEKAGDRCGTGSRHSTFTIGEAGDLCGYEARHSTFTIEKAGHWCGHGTKSSTFTIGKTEDRCGFGAEYSTFKTHYQKQYKRFKESVPQRRGNALYLLAADGSILKGGKW